ncbi:MAG TPA: response regulator transcription factor [Acetobacteraceae bacterium]|jgi:two-component system, cell cycle response regulator CtrA|nr:response regulator transcription factor [Acetobacteraceae bacterium]
MLVLRVGKSQLARDNNDAAALRQHAVRAEQAQNGREALEFLRLYEYDLVLMDLHLSDMPGHEVVRMMRAADFKVPVLMLADTATAQAKARALDQGADDFITTPCDAEELFARIRAIVRRSQGHAKSVLRLGPVELSLDRREVRVHGQQLHLSRREFAVLELLFLKQGVILNKVAFLNHLYCGMEEPEMKTIDVIICRLRKKLAVAGVPTLIDTVWGCGYILRDPSLAPEVAAGAPHWPAQVAVAA